MTDSFTLFTNGVGYEELVATEDGKRHCIKHHRLILYARHELDSPFFSDDMREVHHRTPVPWLNTPENLIALHPEEHREVDDGRGRIFTSWDIDEPTALPDSLRERCQPCYE